MRTLEGRVGIVTGGASGIGREITKKLTAEGAKVYAIGLIEADVSDLDNTQFIQCDVTNFDKMCEIITKIGETEGLDFLVNNAGITIKKRAEDFTLEEFEKIQKINVTAVYMLSTLAYPYLKKSNHIGRIVNISSMAAHLGFSEVVPYCVSKSAVMGITRGLATEWRLDNIRVNSVAPGWFPSEMTQGVMDPQRHSKIMNQIGLETFGDPKDIGHMISFLLSDQATYINGQDFAVDGGALTFGY